MREFTKKRFDIGGYLSRGYEIFKRNPWLLIGFTVVYFVIALIMNMVPFIGPIISGLLSPALVIGFGIIANKLDKGEEASLSNGFDGFKKITPFIIYALIILGIMLLFILVIGGTTLIQIFTGGMSDDPAALIDFFTSKGIFFIIPIFIFTLIYYLALIYAPFFIYFDDMQPLDAIKSSFTLALKNPIALFLLLIILGIISIIATILLVLPILAAIPVMYSSIYAAWKDQSGYEDGEDSSTSVIDNLV
jgi:uncharacterized membrane protein